MKNYFCILVFALISQGLFAQWETKRLPKPFQVADSNDHDLTEKKNPVDFHLSMGTEIFTGGGFTSSLFWISPEIAYQVSPKFVLITGFTYGTGLFDTPQRFPREQEVDLSPREKRNQIGSIYVRGEYQVNNRLQVAASGFYQSGMPFLSYYPGISNVESFGFSAEMQYKIAENSFLNVNIAFIQSDFTISDFYYSPYSGYSGRDPFLMQRNVGFGSSPSLFRTR